MTICQQFYYAEPKPADCYWHICVSPADSEAINNNLSLSWDMKLIPSAQGFIMNHYNYYNNKACDYIPLLPSRPCC